MPLLSTERNKVKSIDEEVSKIDQNFSRSQDQSALNKKRDRLQTIRSKAKKIIDDADQNNNGYMSNEQQTQFDTLIQESESITAWINEPSGRQVAPNDPQNNSPMSSRSKGKKSEWVDSEGKPVVVLAANESLQDSGDNNNAHYGAGEALRALITGNWPDDGGVLQSALATGQDGSGGYILNPIMSNQIIDLSRKNTVIIPAGARTVVMPSSEFIIAKVTGDPTVHWTGENKTIPESGSTFGRLTFRARKMATIVKISRELAEDAPNASQIIQSQLAAGIGLEIDRASLLGSGKGEEPTGIFSYNGVLEIPTIGAITYDSFLDAIQKVEDRNGIPSAYIIPPKVKNTLSKLKDSNGSYLTPPSDLTDLSRYQTKQLSNDVSTLGDFSQVMLGIRRSIQVEISIQSGGAFEDDQVWIKARWRGDVQIAKPEHLVKLTGIA